MLRRGDPGRQLFLEVMLVASLTLMVTSSWVLFAALAIVGILASKHAMGRVLLKVVAALFWGMLGAWAGRDFGGAAPFAIGALCFVLRVTYGD